MTEEEHLTLREAADALGISEVSARRWVKSGKLTAAQPGRRYLIPKSAVEKMLAPRGGRLDPAGVLREAELRAESEQLLELDTEEFAALLPALGVGQLIDLQAQLALLLRYRYGPKIFDTQEEILAYMGSEEKERGDRAGELLGLVIKAIEAWANADSEARTKALEPA
ncbi:MAG: helix-turn-helix domain-containing protein [Actinomycetota bacterium]|jgi:excisionase family DNA binding protein|nr:helix-turn-helix domain-containing protein [Actinomycetota bacterium]